MNRIISHPEICHGKPCIKGTRIPVAMVLELIEEGISFEQIRKDYYPTLSNEDIKACIEYAKKIIENEEIYFVNGVALYENSNR